MVAPNGGAGRCGIRDSFVHGLPQILEGEKGAIPGVFVKSAERKETKGVMAIL